MTNFQWLTKDQVANRLQVSQRTIDRWIADGRIVKYTAEGIRTARYRSSDVDALMTPYIGPAKVECANCCTKVQYTNPGEEDNDNDTRVCNECGMCVACGDDPITGGCHCLYCPDCGEFDDKIVCTPSGDWDGGPLHVCPWNSNSAD